MCGINLIVDRTGRATLDTLKNMMDKTRHRGPDRSHTRIIRKPGYQILFGVNRLSVIDENPDSDQPFFEKDESFFLLYNGEIYNQAEIKNDLIGQGIQFSTFSDTEVLYHYLKENPFPPLPRLQGMYAFIFIDPEREVLTIARDPWGMKPLYYYLNDSFLIISSEIGGILASGLVDKTLDPGQLSWYLRYRFTDPPHTLLKDIESFLKGHAYRFKMRDFSLKESGLIPVPGPPGEETDGPDIPHAKFDAKRIMAEVEELLVNSLIMHTQSVRPPGLFLSGGVDSTLLLALADKHGIFLPHVFSIVNLERDRTFGTEDYKYVKLAVEQYHPSPNILEIDHSILNEIDEFIGMMDHPVGDAAFFLTHKLASVASPITNVVLSGAGADELFSGYHRHEAFFYYLKYFKKIQAFAPVIKQFLGFIPSDFSFYGRKRLVLLKKLFSKIDKEPSQTYDNFIALDKLSPALIPYEWDMNKMKNPVSEAFLLALERDRQEYLPEDILAISDRACMMNGVEMRMPYLDGNIVSYIRRIETEWLIERGRKWILKSLLSELGGSRYVNRPKEGFGFPFGQWIKKPEYADLMSGMVNQKNLIYNYVDRTSILKIVQDHFTGREDNSQEIWSFFLLNAWIEKNFN
jgi:asparagine synthase (glutamine-hydrolysing)